MDRKIRQMNNENPYQDYIGVKNVTNVYYENAKVSFDKVLEYEFINLSNVPIMVGNLFLDRYFSGAANNPTIISGSYHSQKFIIKSGERDTGEYAITFLDSYYLNVNPVHRVYVIRKVRSEAVVTSQF